MPLHWPLCGPDVLEIKALSRPARSAVYGSWKALVGQNLSLAPPPYGLTQSLWPICSARAQYDIYLGPRCHSAGISDSPGGSKE
ncbi:hypothetical protein BDV41DRAFT_551577 [Aspergillus transmontanensis]|uniref:Uncharacterized protein n=1 Tax=Aspergillus transmontanensis TaxID=1034304 RepID=A0A5N6VN69_9EURO|nr:hypothetical protein BDV41DRAFT_551577 [Aspergillus transmontanensis]